MTSASKLQPIDTKACPSVTAAIIRLEDLLGSGDLNAAAELLHQETPAGASRAQLRHLAHIRGRIHFMRGEWQDAADILSQAIDSFGPHVGLISNLASCYYLLGEMRSWARTVEILEREFLLAKPLLSPKSVFRTCITLGKHFEELGRIAPALRWYEELSKIPELPNDRYFHTIIQLLRLNAFLERRTELGSWYMELTTLIRNSPSKTFEIEIEHGLMQAESALLGLGHGTARARSILSRSDLNPGDLRLIVFDHMEAILMHTAWTPGQGCQEYADILQRAESFPVESLDGFERMVLNWFRSLNPPGIAEFVIESKRMSPMASFRILALCTRLSRDPREQEEFRRRLLLSIDSLDRESGVILCNKWTSDLRSGTINLVLDLASRQLVYHERSLDLARKKTPFQLLCLLLKTKSVGWDELVHTLWNADYDQSYYDRVRICVRRLNKDLEKLAATTNAILVDADGIHLRDNVELTSQRG